MVGTILLDKKYSLEIIPKAPFNFDATFHKPTYFPSQNIFGEKGKFWKTLNFDNKFFGLKFENKGNINKPKIKLSIFFKNKIRKKEKEKIIKEIKYWYDLESDLSEFYQKFKNDKILKPIFKKFKGMRIAGGYPLYEASIIYIVLQNASIKRSIQMLQNLFEKFGRKLIFDKKELYAFWKPEKLAKVKEKELRALKVGYRAKFFKKISQIFAKKQIDENKLRKLSKDEAKKELLKLPGIGSQSVWYALSEVFHHYDAFDYISPWEQKIYSQLLFKKKLVSAKKILREVKKRWGKYRMLASRYIFEDLFWKKIKYI